MFINNFDPIAISIFSFDLRWYSLSYVLGILLGWSYIKIRFIPSEIEKKKFDNYITLLIIGLIVGGRIGYVLIYNLDYYIKNLIEVFFIWEGGMSFHGGVVGIIIVTYLFSQKDKKKTFKILDLVSLAAPIGIFLGRIANFINSELYGRETELSWSVVFIKIDNLPRHPSQIYEAFFEGFILFILLNFIFIKSRSIPGKISGYFLIFYSIFRFLIEFTREPDIQIGLLLYQLTLGQLISIITLILGLAIIITRNEKEFT